MVPRMDLITRYYGGNVSVIFGILRILRTYDLIHVWDNTMVAQQGFFTHFRVTLTRH